MPPLLQRLNRPVVAIVAVAAIAAGVRVWHLSRPSSLIFDEIYYAKAGCIYVGSSDDVCRVESSDERFWRTNKWDVGSWVHPPLGKWMTAMGIKSFGMDAFGWRIMSALEGTLIAVFVASMAQLLFRSALWTLVAGFLTALEHLDVVMSRLALLDIHLTFWITLGFLLLLLDRRWIDRETPPQTEPLEVAGPDGQIALMMPRWSKVPSPLWRPWRFAAGASLGAACAVKWSGLTALVAAVILATVWETSRRHRGEATWSRAFGRTLLLETFGLALAFLVLPAAVYVLTWIPWFHHFGWSPSGWWRNQAEMWRYHTGLKEFALDDATKTYTPTHPYYSRPWTWLPMIRPVNFYVRDLGPDIRQILAVGSPAVFWGSLWAVPYAAFAWRRTRDWRAGFVVVPFLVQYLAWFAVRRPQFFFYALPLVPFMVLAIVLTLRQLSDARLVIRDETGEVASNPETGGPAVSERHPYRPFVWAFVALAAGLFVWFWPVLSGARISDAHWRVIVWFRGWL